MRFFNTNDWILINIDWSNGQRTVFEKDRDSLVWVMYSRDGNIRMVKPDFASKGESITIGFPTTRNRYNLAPDGLGYFHSIKEKAECPQHMQHWQTASKLV